MDDEIYFTLNINNGVDTLHVDHPWEACNVDDAEDIQRVEPMTAEAMLLRGDAVRCEHCQPSPEG